ncbi:MAG: RNA 2',3'-cyclic phosphodiesterase [Spirochaetaceae bacterium]|jgi:2'-5' RNA ligase|nr:RNA 2',3'-cyclic phosphodiesterase [Spirochaetaceae bacterium]
MIHRLFIAIDPPDSIRSSIHSICGGMKKVKWVTEDQIHLTIRFIGDIDELVFKNICQGLSTLKPISFLLKVQDLGHFPLRGNPKVLWAGVEENRELVKLYKSVNSVVESCRLEPEHRKFSPHITLGRIKGESVETIAEYLRFHSKFKTPSFDVLEYHLYSSILTPDGAIHEKIATFQF